MIAVIEGGIYIVDRETWEVAIGILIGTAGLALLAGFLTPFASSLVALATMGIAFSGLPQPASSLFRSTLPALLVAVVGLAVAFLGPGAISLDCRLFGRREIIIPSSRQPKP